MGLLQVIYLHSPTSIFKIFIIISYIILYYINSIILIIILIYLENQSISVSSASS